MLFFCADSMTFHVLALVISMVYSIEISTDSTFALDLCALSPPYKLQGQRLGLLQHNSSTDKTSYEWCSCSVCDTSIDLERHEDSYSFYAGTLLLFTSAQSLNYTYPHGTGWLRGQWANNTREGSFSTSLYQQGKCTNFTLYLRSSMAQLVIHLDFEVNRSEVTVTCIQKGPDRVSDAAEGGLSDPGDDPQTINVNTAAISIGVVAVVVFLVVAGICVFCKLNSRSRESSHHLAEDDDTIPKTSTSGVSNPLPSPKLHRDLDILAIQLKSSTLLGYDNATPLSINEDGSHENPGYEPIGDSGYETVDDRRHKLEGNSSLLEEELHQQRDTSAENNFYYRLSESQSKLPCRCSDPCNCSSNDSNSPTSTEDTLYPAQTETEVAGSSEIDANYYEDVVIRTEHRPSSSSSDLVDHLEAVTVAEEYSPLDGTRANKTESTEL